MPWLVLLMGCGARTELDGKPPSPPDASPPLDASPPCTPLVLADLADCPSCAEVTSILADGDSLYFNGTASRLAKQGGAVHWFDHTGDSAAADVALDETYVYWVDGEFLWRHNKSQEDEYDPYNLAAIPSGAAIADNADDIYVVSAQTKGTYATGYTIWKLAKSGGDPVAIVSLGAEVCDMCRPTHIAVASDGVYASVPGATGGVIHTDANGSFVEWVVHVDEPDAIAVDDSSVYLTAYGAAPGAMSFAKSGSMAPFYYATIGSVPPTSIVVDATRLFWTDGVHGAVYASPKTQAAPLALVTTTSFPSAVAVDDQCVYYAAKSATGHAQITRAPKN